DFGMELLHLADEPFPEVEWLGVRVIDAKGGNAAFDPEEDDALHLLPERRPCVGVEIDRVDVLVLFRRVFGLLDGAGGTVVEPLRVLADIRMVGGALDGEVERDFDAVVLRRPDERLEVGQRSKARLDALVAAEFVADGPGTSRVVWSRRKGIVLPL